MSKQVKTTPIFNLGIARRLLRKGFKMHDVNINKFSDGNDLVFFFVVEDDLERVLKDEFNINI